MATPVLVIDKRLSREADELKSDITNLEKKLHYLETTHKNSRENIEQILRAGLRT
jgi:prefoldin subunit 1